MSEIRLTLAYVRSSVSELLRYPMFVLPTICFPALLFLLFAAPSSARDEPNVALAGFAGMAILGIAFFQFGVGIAIERTYAWETFLRTLPAQPRTRIAARALTGLAFGLVAVALVAIAALATTDVSLPAGRWPQLAIALAAGAIPFALFGIALGYWIPPKAALAVANVIFLPLALAGGLFAGPDDLPEPIASVSPALPTRQWAELLWGAVDGDLWQPISILALVGFTALFGLLAVAGYRRDEGQRFR